MAVTMAHINSQARLMTNTLGSGYFDDAVEMPYYINFAVSDVYDRVVAAYSEYFMAQAQFALTTSNDILLTDIITPVTPAGTTFYKELGVDYWPSGSAQTAVTVLPIGSYTERNAGNVWGGGIYGPERRYNILGNILQILPSTTNFKGAYNLIFVPSCPVLSDIVDLPVEMERWVKLISLKVAKMMKSKREQPIDDLTADIALQERRIDEMAHHRIKEGKRIPQHANGYAGWQGWGNSGYGGP